VIKANRREIQKADKRPGFVQNGGENKSVRSQCPDVLFPIVMRA